MAEVMHSPMGKSGGEVQPSAVSSIKESPKWWSYLVPSTEMWWRPGALGVKEDTIRIKHKSHKKGPKVEPWPGPYSKASAVFW